MRRRHFIGLMAAGVAGGFAGVGLAAPPPIGKPAPDFNLALTDGRTVSLKDFRGKALLVNFWSSGWPHCQRESPVLSALSEKYKDRGLIVLGINVPWDKAQLVRVFMDAYKVTYLVGRDASGTICNLYDVEATPASLFIDKAGRLVAQHVGALPEAEFQRRVEALLK